MTHFEDKVRQALSAEDAKLYDTLGHRPNLVQAAFETLSNENRLFAVGGWVLGFAMFGLAAYAGSGFFAAESMRDLVGLAATAVIALFALGFIKIWFFMEAQKDALMRELRRIEPQLMALQRAES